MLSRKYRINTEKFPEVTRGRVFQNESLRVVVKYDIQLKNPKYAVIVPNKIAKTAVVRNSLRRKIYSIVGLYIDKSPIAYISLYPKKTELNVSEIKKSIEDLVCLKK